MLVMMIMTIMIIIHLTMKITMATSITQKRQCSHFEAVLLKALKWLSFNKKFEKSSLLKLDRSVEP